MKKSFIFFALILAVVSILSGFGEQIDPSLMKKVDELSKLHPTEGAVASDKISLESIDNYKNAALELHKEIEKIKSKEVLTTVTFNDPISSDDIIGFIDKYDIRPELIYAYGEEQRQEGYVTGGIFFDEEDDISEIKEMVNEAEQDIEEGGEASFIGFLSVIGQISPDKISSIQSDERIYLADICADEYFGRNDGYVQHLGYELYALKQQ